MAEPTRRLAPKGADKPRHRYVPSFATDIRRTFRRVRKELSERKEGTS